MNMLKVSRRGGFSDRNGIKPENKEIQLYDLDERTRVQIYNTFCEMYKTIWGEFQWFEDEIQDFYRFVYSDIYSVPISTSISYSEEQFMKYVKDTFLKDEYDAVLTFIEGVVDYSVDYTEEKRGMYTPYGALEKVPSIYDVFNECFTREYVGYRFVDKIIVPISDEYEIKTIEDALQSKYEPVREHISKANLHLADRDKPDYENSIKESISAVEALCVIILDAKGRDATLGQLLKKFEDRGIVIHPALKSSFNTLYGYTSDASGIRHAKNLGGVNSTFEEAKFMLVSCCAFVNYIIGLEAQQ